MTLCQKILKFRPHLSCRSVSGGARNQQRGKFSVVAPRDIEFFNSVLGNDRVFTDSTYLEPHNIDFMKYVHGNLNIG